jgi:NSS family neurotransmitter:Na+ symporter
MAQAGRGSFSNRLGFIAAAAGSAVGLGNIWKFPYETGLNGGAAFLLVYLLCTVVICFPILIAEIAVGRHAQRNPYGSYKFIGGKGWGVIGTIGILVGIAILSFYNVVAGWAFGFFLQTSFGDLLNQEDFGSFFTRYTANVGDNLIYSMAFMVLTGVIVAGGVQKGIERWTKILMPTLLTLVLGLIIYGLTLENAADGVRFYLVPDFSKINGPTLFSALSQAFFSLSLGMGAIITYGSYFSKSDSIVNSAALVTTTDMLIAFLSGLLVFPLVFFQGIEPTQGPGLVFVTMPAIFQEMGTVIGPLVGGAFFLLLCFAALTSTVSLLEVPVAYLKDEFRLRRGAAVALLAGVIFLLGLPSMLAHGASPFFTEFAQYGGATHNFMDTLITVFSDIGLPFGGLMISIFVAYKWRFSYFGKEIEQGHDNFKGSLIQRFISVMLGFVSPVFVAAILVITILETFLGVSVF